jgi:hypothetical protein
MDHADLETKTFAELRELAIAMRIQPARSRKAMVERIIFFRENPKAGRAQH